MKVSDSRFVSDASANLQGCQDDDRLAHVAITGRDRRRTEGARLLQNPTAHVVTVYPMRTRRGESTSMTSKG
jgi:hypothetical protein